jgi:hypothetical protein
MFFASNRIEALGHRPYFQSEPDTTEGSSVVGREAKGSGGGQAYCGMVGSVPERAHDLMAPNEYGGSQRARCGCQGPAERCGRLKCHMRGDRQPLPQARGAR